MEVGKYLIEGGRVVGKRCTKCQRLLPLEQFSRKEKGSGRLKSHCKSCVRARSQAHYLHNVDNYVQRSAARKTALRQRARQVRDAFLSGKCCEVCGSTDSLRVYAHQGRGKRFQDLVRDPPTDLSVEDLERAAAGARFLCKRCLGSVGGIMSRRGVDLSAAMAEERPRASASQEG